MNKAVFVSTFKTLAKQLFRLDADQVKRLDPIFALSFAPPIQTSATSFSILATDPSGKNIYIAVDVDDPSMVPEFIIKMMEAQSAKTAN